MHRNISVGYFATISLAVLGYVIGGAISLTALLLSAYFAGTLNVFQGTVWVITFLKLTETMDVTARENG